MSEARKRTKIGISNLNLPRRDIALGDVDRMRQILDLIDPYREVLTHGMELTPTKKTMLTAGKLRRLPASELFYNSVHQSWGKGVPGALKAALRQDFVQAGGGVVLTEQHASLRGLDRLAKVTGHNVPAVVFGNDTHRGVPTDFSTYRRFKWTGAQPSAAMEGIQEAHEKPYLLGNSYRMRRIGKVIWDNHHVIVPDKNNPGFRPNLDDVVNAVRTTGMEVGAIHASAGRFDTAVGDDLKHTYDDLHGLVKGNISNTRMGEVLAAGCGVNPPEYAILEVPHGATAEYVRSENDFHKLTYDMALHLQEFVNGLGSRE